MVSKAMIKPPIPSAKGAREEGLEKFDSCSGGGGSNGILERSVLAIYEP